MRPTEVVLETLVQSPFNHLTQLVAGESFIDWGEYFGCVTDRTN
jgi:hypothetical protein